MVAHNPDTNDYSPRKRSWTIGHKITVADTQPKREKYDFQKMKSAATHEDPLIRKEAFIEYFERFSEFPSYLFDNEHKIDLFLAITMQDIVKDKNSSKELLEGVTALLNRLPS